MRLKDQTYLTFNWIFKIFLMHTWPRHQVSQYTFTLPFFITLSVWSFKSSNHPHYFTKQPPFPLVALCVSCVDVREKEKSTEKQTREDAVFKLITGTSGEENRQMWTNCDQTKASAVIVLRRDECSDSSISARRTRPQLSSPLWTECTTQKVNGCFINNTASTDWHYSVLWRGTKSPTLWGRWQIEIVSVSPTVHTTNMSNMFFLRHTIILLHAMPW